MIADKGVMQKTREEKNFFKKTGEGVWNAEKGQGGKLKNQKLRKTDDCKKTWGETGSWGAR